VIPASSIVRLSCQSTSIPSPRTPAGLYSHTVCKSKAAVAAFLGAGVALAGGSGVGTGVSVGGSVVAVNVGGAVGVKVDVGTSVAACPQAVKTRTIVSSEIAAVVRLVRASVDASIDSPHSLSIGADERSPIRSTLELTMSGNA
jgi:hypothetical protein